MCNRLVRQALKEAPLIQGGPSIGACTQKVVGRHYTSNTPPCGPFMKYIPFHRSTIRKKQHTPLSELILKEDMTEVNYVYELGKYFHQMLSFYFETERNDHAASLVRNVLCSQLLHSRHWGYEIEDLFYEWYTGLIENSNKNKVEEIMDIIIYFAWKERRYPRAVLNCKYTNLLSAEIKNMIRSDDQLENRIALIEGIIADHPRKYEMLKQFHSEFARTAVILKQWNLLSYVDFIRVNKKSVLDICQCLIIHEQFTMTCSVISELKEMKTEDILADLGERVGKRPRFNTIGEDYVIASDYQLTTLKKHHLNDFIRWLRENSVDGEYQLSEDFRMVNMNKPRKHNPSRSF